MSTTMHTPRTLLIVALALSFTLAACSDSDPSHNDKTPPNNALADIGLEDATSEDTDESTDTEDLEDIEDPEDTSEDIEDPEEPFELLGILDETFAAAGPTPGVFAGPTNLRSDGSGLVVTPTGNILVAGRSRLITAPDAEEPSVDFPKMFTVQLSSAGELTSEFGTSSEHPGVALLPLGAEANDIVVLATELQPDGKTITCGHVRSTQMGRSQLFVARLNADGTPDATFGNNPEMPGRAYFDVPVDKPNSLCWALHVLPSGKILAAGQVGANSTLTPLLMRLNADGTLDETFGNTPAHPASIPGTTLHDIFPDDTWHYALIRELAVLADGKILALIDSLHLQTGRKNGYLLRFEADGTLDETFATVTLELPNGASHEVFDFTVEPTTGRIFIAGKVQHIAGLPLYRAFVHALSADGQPDPTFSTYILDDLNAAARAILLQPDGKILAVGSSITHPDTSFEAGELLVIRLDPTTGQPDLSFATGGVLLHESTTHTFYAARAHFDPEGRLILTGSTPIDNAYTPRGHTFITRIR